MAMNIVDNKIFQPGISKSIIENNQDSRSLGNNFMDNDILSVYKLKNFQTLHVLKMKFLKITKSCNDHIIKSLLDLIILKSF